MHTTPTGNIPPCYKGQNVGSQWCPLQKVPLYSTYCNYRPTIIPSPRVLQIVLIGIKRITNNSSPVIYSDQQLLYIGTRGGGSSQKVERPN